MGVDVETFHLDFDARAQAHRVLEDQEQHCRDPARQQQGDAHRLGLDQELRADAIRVSTARQILQGGQWVDTSVQAGTNQKLEDVILQKARDLRRNAAG